MNDLSREAQAFRSWASRYPDAGLYGEWECDYPDWPRLHEATLSFVAEVPFSDWSPSDVNDVLYVIARDNEIQWVAGEIARRSSYLVVQLAAESTRHGDRDARWQLAAELGKQPPTEQGEAALLELAADPDEYVRRHALQALAQTGSGAVEELALAAWARPDEHQQWTRMMVLHCLALVGSPHVQRQLIAADLDGREWLVKYATRIRRGELP